MPHARIVEVLSAALEEFGQSGRLKGAETEFIGLVEATDGRGPRYLLKGEEGKLFLRMNSNSYLGLTTNPGVIEAEEQAVETFGAGPGAVRFISIAAHRQIGAKLTKG